MDAFPSGAQRAAARRIALLYAAAASAWIVASDLFVALMSSGISSATAAGVGKGLLFVAVTAVLLYLLLARGSSAQALLFASEHPSGPDARSAWRALAPFIVLFAALLGAGVWLFLHDARLNQNNARADLVARTELKAREIEIWLQHLSLSALTYRRARFLQEEFNALSRGDAAARARVDARLEEIRQSLELDDILVLDSAGRALAGSGREISASQALLEDARAVVQLRVPRLHWLREEGDRPGSPLVLENLVPIELAPDRPPAGVIVLREQISRSLLPMVHFWPIASRTTNSYLARKMRDHFEFVGGTERGGSTLRLGGPAAERDRIERDLQRGVSFVAEAQDERGTALLLAATPISGTDWRLITRIEREEVVQAAREQAVLFAALILGLTVLAAFAASLLWRQQVQLAGMRERALAAERDALGKHLQLLSRHANDIVLLFDADGRIVQANDRAFELYGRTREEMIGQPGDILRAPREAESFRECFVRVLEQGSATFEGIHVRRDGSEFPVDISARRIDTDQGRFVQAIARDISERKTAERELRESEETYRSLFAHMLNGFAYCRMLYEDGRPADFVYLAVNQAFEAQTGLKNVVGRRVTEVIPGIRESDPTLLELYGRVARTGQPERIEIFVESLQQWFWISAYSPKSEHFVAVFDVITERKRTEARVVRLARLREALSAINRAIVHATNEQSLFETICGIAVERAGLTLALVGLVDAVSGDGRVVAWNGEPQSLIQNIRITTRDAPEAQRPISMALRGQRTIVYQDLRAVTGVPWSDFTCAAGLLSLAVFPIRRGGKVAGAVAVYSSSAGFFDAETLALLEEMAQDLSFSLDVMAHDRELHESEARFRALIEQTITGIFVIQDGKLVYVNPRAREIFGFDPADQYFPDILSLIAEPDRARVLEEMKHRLTDQPSAAYSIAALRKDGTPFTLGMHSTRATYRGRPAIIVVGQDITEKARAEAEIQGYIERLQEAVQSTIEVVSTIGEMRDPYTHGHERRVGELAARIAEEMGLDRNRVEGIRVAGYVHDVGKIGVPAEILAKPSRLSKAEFDLVKQHPQQSYEILKGVDFPWPVAGAAWQHHERVDGSGYPQGLKGDAIILEARILGVADVVEAMSSHRPYRPGLGIEAALAEIEKNRGRLYDIHAADACLRLFRIKGYALDPA